MRRVLTGITALTALMLLVVGVPAVLAATIGNPAACWADLRAGDLTSHVLIDILAAVAWIAWAQFITGLAGSIVATARQTPHPVRVPLVPGASQQLAHTLFAAALLLAGTASVSAPAFAASPTPPGPHSVATSSLTGTVGDPIAETAPRGHTASPAADPAPANRTQPADERDRLASNAWSYVIPAGGTGPDTYWDIAEQHCGGGENWHTIWDLNRGRTQPDGAVLTDPGILRPGWTILIPQPHTADLHDSLMAGPASVTVRPGDTLSAIANQHEIPDWHTLWQTNKGDAEPDGAHLTDPDLLRPGWTLTLPPTPASGAPGAAAQRTTTPPRPVTPLTQPGATPPPTNAPTEAPPAPAPAPTPTPTVSSTAPEPASTSPATDAPTETPSLGPAAALTPSNGARREVFGGGTALLAGLSLAALVRYRRRQHRWRRPGRAIATAPSQLQHIERDLLLSGSAGLADVDWLDRAMRSLGIAVADRAPDRLPDVLAVRMTDDDLDLILAAPQTDPPPPWTTDDTGARWSLRRSADLPYDHGGRGDYLAPFPALVSLGYTADGQRWLLDLERTRTLTLTGDRDRCLNLARFLAAELAHNSWSDMLTVALAGFGAELAHINPDRLSHDTDPARPIKELTAELAAVTEAQAATDTDLLAARLAGVDGDSWAPHVLLLAADQPTTDHDAAEVPGLAQLLSDLDTAPARCAAAVVLIDPPEQPDTGWVVTLEADGTLHLPALDLTLTAHQVPFDEAADLAQALALAADIDDQDAVASRGDQPWDAYADTTGALREEFSAHNDPQSTASNTDDEDAAADTGNATEPGDAQPVGDRAAALRAPGRAVVTTSLLSRPPLSYVDAAATTVDDVRRLAPAVTTQTRDAVHDADPDFDADLADWHDPHSTRPKISVLGPIQVRAQGSLPPARPRLAWHTEVAVYLATRERPVSAERINADLWPDEPHTAGKTRVRQSIAITRKWLGINTRTGREHLPRGTSGTPAAYRVEDALLDADLFRRLRLRGTTRGHDGIADLHAALDLVTGPPFDNRRPTGYSWLAYTPLDHEYAAMIVDTAHTLATHHLAEHEPQHAAEAAHTALRAGSTEDTPLLDLVAAYDAAGDRAQANAVIKRILTNHDAEVEEDLPPRTAEILHRRHWLDR